MALESIEALRVFVQVVDSEGLSAAGRVLGLAPTLVSRRISALEEDLGVRLLQRTTRRLHVTDEGRAFYRRCRRILVELETAAEEVRAVASDVGGTVRAVLPTVTASLGVMTAAAELLERHPGLALQLSFSDQPTDLVAGGWDVALHVGRPADSTHTARPLPPLAPVLAATPEYLARAGIPQQPEDLGEHECLRFISDRPQDTWTLISDQGREQVVPVHGRFECDNSAALGDAMLAGIGIGIRHAWDVERAVAEGRLVRVLPGWSLSAFPLFLLTPAGRNRIPRVRVFADWLANYMEAQAS
ncbi:MAG: LysR family transcriptional regulator [Myxococcota bacterium]